MSRVTSERSDERGDRALRLFLLLSLVHVCVASFVPALPGWKMFTRVERFQYRLVDGASQSVHLEDIAPMPHYVTGAASLFEAAAWLARRDEAAVGLSLRVPLRESEAMDQIVTPSGATSACLQSDPRALCVRLRSAWDRP